MKVWVKVTIEKNSGRTIKCGKNVKRRQVAPLEDGAKCKLRDALDQWPHSAGQFIASD